MKAKKTMLALVLAAATAVVVPVTASSLHFGLRSSVPEADATVAPPELLTLTFTQVPQENSVSIRLVDAAGELVETGDPMPDEDEGNVVRVHVAAALAAGAYTVAWRGIGDDGHVVRGDFGFAVTTQ